MTFLGQWLPMKPLQQTRTSAQTITQIQASEIPTQTVYIKHTTKKRHGKLMESKWKKITCQDVEMVI